MFEPVLALPAEEGMYILTSSIRTTAWVVLSQQQDDGERVIVYSSRTMSKTELKYETTRKDLLAVVIGLKQFRQYLLGRHFASELTMQRFRGFGGHLSLCLS